MLLKNKGRRPVCTINNEHRFPVDVLNYFTKLEEIREVGTSFFAVWERASVEALSQLR